jgi:ubiquinone/menaquinone biosynthesis C-methylase UbiE/DNA-binding transcriptional ArsR family regulator
MAHLAEHLRLLADETRLRILHLLSAEPLTVAELQQILDLSQSSISGHLAKIKNAGLIIDVAEGSARRYRLREDLSDGLRTAWNSIKDMSADDGQHVDDHARLDELRDNRGGSWVERVAGCLHRSYAPGRTWQSLCHGLISFAEFGRCVDVGAGDGALAELIAARSREVICIDPSPAMVREGVARIQALKLTNVRYHEAKGEQLPLKDECCDSVLYLQSLQYVDEPGRALSEAIRVLAPKGRLLVLTLKRHQFHKEAGAFGHRHFGFTVEQLRGWTKALAEHHAYDLPAESRLPRFQSLVFTAVKTGAKRTRKE